jgi:hypothetical protein
MLSPVGTLLSVDAAPFGPAVSPLAWLAGGPVTPEMVFPVSSARVVSAPLPLEFAIVVVSPCAGAVLTYAGVVVIMTHIVPSSQYPSAHSVHDAADREHSLQFAWHSSHILFAKP